MISRGRAAIIGALIISISGFSTWYVLHSRSSADLALANLPAECLADALIDGGPEPLAPTPIAGPNADGLTLSLEQSGSSIPTYAQGFDNPIYITINNQTQTDVASRSPNANTPTGLDAIDYFVVKNSAGEKIADNLGDAIPVLDTLPTLAAFSNQSVSWNQVIGADSESPTVAPIGTYTINFPNTEGPLQFTLALEEAMTSVGDGQGVGAPNQVEGAPSPADTSMQSFEDINALRGSESNPAQLTNTVVCPDGIRLAFDRPVTPDDGGIPPVPTEGPEVTPPRVIGPNDDGLELVMWQHADGFYDQGEPIRMFLSNTTDAVISSRATVAPNDNPTSLDKIDYFVVLNSAGKPVATSVGDAIEVLTEPHFLAANGYIQGIVWSTTLGEGSSFEGPAPADKYTIRFPNTAGPLEVEVTIVELSQSGANNEAVDSGISSELSD